MHNLFFSFLNKKKEILCMIILLINKQLFLKKQKESFHFQQALFDFLKLDFNFFNCGIYFKQI